MAGRRTRRYRPRGRIPSLCPLRAQARLRQLFRVSRPEVFLGGFVGEWSGRAAKGPGLAATHPWFRRGRSRSACVANGQEYLPARGAVCRIPCRILCLADVERNSMARRTSVRGLRRGPTPTTTTWQLLPLNVQPWLIRLNQLLLHRRPQHRQGFHPHMDVRRTKSRRLQPPFVSGKPCSQ